MARKFAVWGCGGSGKTTFAASLAAALAYRNYIVGLVSANLQHGDIQVFFGQTIYEDKGTFMALMDKGAEIKEKFWKAGLPGTDNLFLLSVPNGYDGILADNVTGGMVKQLYESCEMAFDYLVIDCCTDINNGISSIGLTVSDKVFTLYKPSVAANLWHASCGKFRDYLGIDVKTVPILNRSNSCHPSLLDRARVSFKYALPRVGIAEACENDGKPLYIVNSRECKAYARVVDKLCTAIC